MDFHGGSIPFPSSPLVRSCFRRDVPLATHFFPLLSTIFSPLLSFHSHWNHPNLSPVLPLQPQAVRSTQRARPPGPLPPPPRTGQARPPLSSLTRRTSAVTSMRTSESRSTPPAPLAAAITLSDRLRLSLPRPPPVLTLSAPSRSRWCPRPCTPLPIPSSGFGSAPIAWGLNRDARPTTSMWSAARLAEASAAVKVSSGRWQSKPPEVKVIRSDEITEGLERRLRETVRLVDETDRNLEREAGIGVVSGRLRGSQGEHRLGILYG